MDHLTAHLIVFINKIAETKEIDSAFSQIVIEDVMEKGQKTLHNTEQQNHAAYYKEIASFIRNYDAVLSFGPTDAKSELLNFLKNNY